MPASPTTSDTVRVKDVKQSELAASSMRWMQTALEAFVRNESQDLS